MRMLAKRLLVVTLVTLPLALGCGSSGSGNSGTAGSGGQAGSGTGGGTGACNTLVDIGSPVAETAGSGTFPTGHGGPFNEGTYVLTKYEIFPPGTVDAYQRKETLRVTGSKIEIVRQRDNDPEARISGTVTQSGNMLSFTQSCPPDQPVSVPYTSTAAEVHLIIASPGLNEVHTYTKQ